MKTNAWLGSPVKTRLGRSAGPATLKSGADLLLWRQGDAPEAESYAAVGWFVPKDNLHSLAAPALGSLGCRLR